MTPTNLNDALNIIDPLKDKRVALILSTGHELSGRVQLLAAGLVQISSMCTCGKDHPPAFVCAENVVALRVVEDGASPADRVRELLNRLSGKSGDEDEPPHDAIDLKRFN